ncbi:uncharacterized protein LOC141686151 [Apium graveolens]|uniref:uncharacterized protein LOC141686151 n=1 Tax=Apium graveolens TaxID=4045 RepID=UPI003D7BA56F
MITLDLLKISANQGSSCGDSSHVSCLVDDYVSDGGNSLFESEISISSFNITPGGHKYYIPKCSGDISKLEVNQSFDSLEKRNSDESSSETVKHRRTVSGRCICKAKCVFKRTGSDKYVVAVFEEKHNHPLASEEGLQFLKASREMTNSMCQHVVDTAKVNIGTSKSFTLMKEQVDGYGNLVLRYNMIFAPFTGVDKHDRCVTFAACLLAKEDISHYTWAFDHFLKTMKRNPVLMVTGQCPTMRATVPEVFTATNEYPATKHHLCMWHIMQKFPVKPGNRICKETDFMEKMKKFIWSSIIEPDEFESGWLSVMKEFKLEGNKWLGKMYSVRKSWIPAYF